MRYTRKSLYYITSTLKYPFNACLGKEVMLMTRIGNGISKGENGFHAAKAAAEKAMEKLNGEKPDVAIVYSSLEYHLDDVYAGVKGVIGDVQLIGASSAGEFTESEVQEKSVAVSLIRSDSCQFFTSSVGDVKGNTYVRAQEVLDGLPSEVDGFEHYSYIVLHDGLIGQGEDIVTNLSFLVHKGRQFSGGAAGDDLQFKAIYVMHNGTVLNNGLVVLMIASKHKVGLGVEHGHEPVSDELEVTKAEENVLYTVNERPAWEVWKDSIREHAREHEGVDVDALEDPAKINELLLKYEMGLKLGEDRYKVRVPLSANMDDGSLNFGVKIFEGSRFSIMYSVKERQLESAREAAERAKHHFDENNGGQATIAGAFVFDCVCRGLILQEDFPQAIENIKEVIGKETPLIGFETYGEVCKGEGDIFTGFHNTTTVVMILPD